MNGWQVGVALGVALGGALLAAYGMGLIDDVLRHLDERRHDSA